MGMSLQGKKLSYKEAIGWLFIGISLVMLGNSVRLCFSRDIWYDELFTMGMIGHSYSELIHFTAQDVHPPLYYCLTKLIVDLCKLIIPSADVVMLVKLVSVIPYFLLLAYALTFLRTKFGIFTAGVFFLCILSMPQMSAYTVEMRMYSLALFFVTAAFFHAYGIICERTRRTRHYVALTLYGLAAAYTQYFACVAVIMIYGYLLIRFAVRYRRARRIRGKDAVDGADTVDTADAADSGKALQGWGVCVLTSIAGYLPWGFILLSQIAAVRENYWILPLTWRSLGGCVKFLMKPAFTKPEINVILAIVLFLIYITLLACHGYRAWKEGKEKKENAAETAERFFYALAGCMVLCGLVGFGFLASIAIRPIFVYRYMLPAAGCFWLCFALDINALAEREKVSRNEILTCVFISALVLTVGIRDYRAFVGEEEYKIVLMKETQQAISDIAQEDIVLYNFDQLQAVAGYYMAQESYLWKGTPEPLMIEMFGNKETLESVPQIKEWLQAGRKVWFFGSFNSREDIRKQWEAEGLMTEEMGSCLLERYWFNIYLLSVQPHYSQE